MIMAAMVAWLSWHRQVRAIAKIEHLGGYVDSTPAGPELFRRMIGDEVMTGFDHVKVLYLEDTRVVDKELEHLNRLAKLLSLDLSNTQVTDAGLVHLKGLTELRILDLSETLVTDAGLRQLKRLTELEILYLQGTQVTDVGVKLLQTSLPKCEIQR